MQGLIVLQSGQPYSVIDYSGAVGSIYYGLNDGITNPIVPLAPGCTPKNAVTGAIGNDPGLPALKASCFTVPLLSKCAVAIQASAAVRRRNHRNYSKPGFVISKKPLASSVSSLPVQKEHATGL